MFFKYSPPWRITWGSCSTSAASVVEFFVFFSSRECRDRSSFRKVDLAGIWKSQEISKDSSGSSQINRRERSHSQSINRGSQRRSLEGCRKMNQIDSTRQAPQRSRWLLLYFRWCSFYPCRSMKNHIKSQDFAYPQKSWSAFFIFLQSCEQL